MTRPLRALLLGAALLVVFADPAAADGPRGVRFRRVDDGFAEARANGKPLLLFFTADWCPPCHSLESDVFASSHFVEQIEADFVPVKVIDRTREDGRNTPEVAGLVKSAGVTGFPTLVVVRPEGAAAVRNVGYSSHVSTLTFLREAVQRLEAAEKKKRRSKER